MTTAEEIDVARRNREAEVKAAWESLAANPSFQTVWMKDLQHKFKPLAPSFQEGDGYNPVPAAMRDGQKAVIAHIAKRLALGVAMLDEEEVTKPTEAVTEFQGERL